MQSKRTQTFIQIFLKERRKRLNQSLKRLSDTSHVIITMEPKDQGDYSSSVLFSSIVRVRKTDYYFHIFEDFRDTDTEPHLYKFSYSLRKAPFTDATPLFRYECHPDVEATNMDEFVNEQGSQNNNPYAITPHFHPDNIFENNIAKLHYPFHRSEREGIVFALISWVEVDLIKRFYET